LFILSSNSLGLVLKFLDKENLIFPELSLLYLLVIISTNVSIEGLESLSTGILIS